ncbi:hypothetical protein VTO42DRAFT_6422 [Malbranchea cinnamomea]
MVQSRLGPSSRLIESLFIQTAKQAYRSQSHLFQKRISAKATNPLIFFQTPSIQSFFLPFSQVRYASHASQGAANAHAKNSPGKRLGAKKTGGEYVIPGNIIFRQRGTKWFPGENCGMGRDHTIFALEAGYVKYYRDPELHPKRKYIGVVFNKEDKLPSPKNAPTKRRLNMIAVPRQVESETESVELSASDSTMKVKLVASKSTNPPLRPGYMYRQANWEIGRAAEKANIKVKEWKRKDRWTAWRKRLEKIKRIAQMNELKNRKKAKKAPKVAKPADN